ncbi:molybdenum cofactor biosysynthesis protein [Symbioplanes lichenis]|uniref:molybdenum cofactor biosysynthesis protein n=1 Tax=Symbioplanes lichenis TaxID=1629072 RepID=UPI002738C844|nr:molybdenum cofactor biosysynthesis protein [Actinoplanes lichenis]
MTAEILQLLASPIHRYEGRPAAGPLPAPEGELTSSVRVRAGLGIEGDRYYAQPAHRDASITIMSASSLPPGADLVQARRNILIAGVPIDDLIGKILTLDSGDGPVRLHLRRRANPCAWMDVVIAPGQFKAMRGKGGARCVPLDDGTLRVGPVEVTVTDP